MLVFVDILLKIDFVQAWFHAHDDLKVCQTLLEVKSLFDSGHLNEERALWLSVYCSPPVDTTDWDIYGSEAKKFVVHLETQESFARTWCSKTLCIDKKKRIRQQ